MSEVITPVTIYTQLSEALLTHGTYPSRYGDAHYLRRAVDLVDSDEQGRLQLDDYHSVFSTEYGMRAAANKAHQERLLRAGRAILNIQLYGADKRSIGVGYTLCHPSAVEPDSAIGILFYGIDGTPPFIGPPSDPDALTIVRSEPTEDHRDDTYAFITEPKQDRQLMLIYGAVTGATEN